MNYINPKKINIQTYNPKRKIDVDKESAIPLLNYFGRELLWIGGLAIVVISGLFMGHQGILRIKKKIRQIQLKREKIIDFRKH